MDDSIRVEKLSCAEAVASRAGTCRIVKRKHSRLEFVEAVSAVWASITRRKEQLLPTHTLLVDQLDDGYIVCQGQCRLKRLSESLGAI